MRPGNELILPYAKPLYFPLKAILAHYPPRPRQAGGWLAGLVTRRGSSLLSLLSRKAYQVQMGTARVGPNKIFLVNAPETIREIMGEDTANYPKHRFLVEILQPLIGISLFNANGEDWRQQRTLVEYAFQHAGLRRAYPVMLTAVDALVERTRALPAGSTWNAQQAMNHVAADIIFRTILSEPLQERQAQDISSAFAT